jgi:Family of unknown function (DUF6220)
MARKIYVGFAWVFVVAVGVQFVLAGLGVLGGESIEAHRQWGFIVLHLVPILMFIAAIVGRMGRTVLILTGALFLLVFVQPLFADPELDPQWLRSLHVLNALFIFALGVHLTQRERGRSGSMPVGA